MANNLITKGERGGRTWINHTYIRKGGGGSVSSARVEPSLHNTDVQLALTIKGHADCAVQ